MVSKNLIQEATRLYTEEKLTQEAIAKKLGVGRSTVSVWFKAVGVLQLRNGPDRRFTLNEFFFELIDAHEKAYWLGFLLADGHVSANKTGGKTIRLELQSSDKPHIEAFLQSTGSNANIRHGVRQLKGSTNHSDWTMVCSGKLTRSLEDKGWHEFKKSGDCRIVQDVPDELIPSLMRGLFDGDGCFMKERATFVDAHLSVCHWFQEKLVRHARIKRAPISPNPGNTSYVVKWSGYERLHTIANFLYSTPGPILKRKLEAARTHGYGLSRDEYAAWQVHSS
jgi:hypothetical protein